LPPRFIRKACPTDAILRQLVSQYSFDGVVNNVGFAEIPLTTRVPSASKFTNLSVTACPVTQGQVH
jgi:hypothetical protein